MVKIDRTKDVLYGAGTSKDEKTVYVDHRVPPSVTLKNGKKVNVLKALVAHETTERKAMDTGMSYQEAHKKFAIPAEDKEVHRQGASPVDYNKAIRSSIVTAGNKKLEDAPTPSDLDPKPYKDTQKLSLLKSLIHNDKNYGQEKKRNR